MAVQTVACPGCKSTLKAPEQMAGKKAKCKKCGTSFRIPGGPEPTEDTVGDSQHLSEMDLPTPAGSAENPFAFDDEPQPPEKPKPAEKLPTAKRPVAAVKPEAKVATPPPKPARAAPKAPPPENEEGEDDEDAIPAAEVVEDEPPEADPLSFDEADNQPAVAAETGGDPFSFSNEPPPPRHEKKEKSKVRDEKREKVPAKPAPAASGDPFAFSSEPAPPEPKAKGKSRSAEAEPAPEKSGARRAYHARPTSSGGGGMSKLLIAAAVFAVITGGIVGGVLIFLNGDKAPEEAKNDKKDVKGGELPPSEPPGQGDNTKGTPTPNPKDKTNPPKKDPGGKKPTTPAGGGAMLALPPGRTINFLPQAANPELIQEPSNRLLIVPNLPGKADNAFDSVRRVFPPLKRDIDIGVLWQTAAGFQGSGEKLLLGIYSPQTGKQANQVAFDGDGAPEPVCDLSVDANLFAHGNTKTSAVTIWDTRSGTKIVDGFNPYAAKKDLKLAAVYLTEPPLFFITVSDSGVVNAFNVKSKEPMPGQFTPTKPPAKPLAARTHIAPGPGRQSVVLLAGSSVYQVNIGPDVTGSEVIRLDGEVGRSFGIAASGGRKLLLAFETDEKKEKAVMELRGDGNHVFYRWPDKDAGEPTTVGWAGDDLAVIGSSRGSCLWFESEGKEFKPVGLARTPNDKGRHVASDGHWALLPDPADPKQCVLVEYSRPQSGLVGALESSKQPPSARLTDKGLFK